MTLTVGSLFSGIGGFDLGLERAGMQVRWQVEIDPFCTQVLAKHWPDVPRYGDITTLDFTEVDPVDLICGGFPCQPVSLAGKRQGQDDVRWLWPEFARAIRVVRPRYALMENVPGLLGLGMGDVLRDLSELGYDAEWQSIPAAAVGAPHLRWRVWILAYPEGDRRGSRRAWGFDASSERPCEPVGAFQDAANTDRQGLAVGQEQLLLGQRQTVERSDWWAVEPDVDRVVTGLPGRVDRLRALGNAIVPQVAEYDRSPHRGGVMTEDELRAALAACHDALAGIMDMGGLMPNQHGHVPGCCFGYWLGHDCQPEPCSKRCRDARMARDLAGRYLDSTEVRQSVLFD
jgi:DNA (cytosine-5)-methyltransferase 1